MENNKFRNHISIVFEKLGVISGALIVFLITNIENIFEFIKDGDFGEDSLTLIIGAGAIFAILTMTIMYQLLLWSKTYISVDKGSIVIERNTLNQKKNTIGIKNISNVNTEQNLFEMLMGTCKVKLDTNSMSTADETDVKIILKKNEAEAFRNYIMSLMHQSSAASEEPYQINESNMEWNFEATNTEIITHGFIAINIVSLVVALGGLIGLIAMIVDTAKQLAQGESVMGMFFGFVMLGGMWFSAMRDLLKGFVKYYDFKIARKGDKLYMRYGLLRKVNYTIPVAKINGIKLKQSLAGRLTGRYMAEIINIGMGDDEEEAESFLFPYCRKETAEARIRQFLPEYDYAQNLEYEKQPKCVWAAWSVPFATFVIVVAFAAGACLAYFENYNLWIVLAAALMIVLGIIYLVVSYVTDGSRFGEDAVLVVDGFIEKKYCFVPYKKIQYVEYKQNPVAAKLNIMKGSVNILASILNRSQAIPYFPQEKAELVKRNMLDM